MYVVYPNLTHRLRLEVNPFVLLRVKFKVWSFNGVENIQSISQSIKLHAIVWGVSNSRVDKCYAVYLLNYNTSTSCTNNR